MKKTHYKRRASSKTTMKRKTNLSNEQVKTNVVKVFIEMLNMIKLYHWKTKSYSQHKATDDLYGKLNTNIDLFVEILMGKSSRRIYMVEKCIRLMDISKFGDFKERIHEHREFLIGLSSIFDAKRDSDLLNVRDEILGDINQFLYLLSFNKI
jgi:hypothetical protein